MAVYKEEKTNTWRAVYRYTDWNGERKQTQKRGFKTKREAQAWEREQLNKTSADLDMTFKSFVDLYTADMKTRLKENTWATKDHIIRTKLLPYFGRLKMCNITAQQIITWQNEMLNHKDENGKPYSPVYLKTVHNQGFISAFKPALDSGFDVLYLAMSSGISGTYQSSCLAANELAADYPQRKIICLDTRCASVGQGFLVREAARMQAEGLSIDALAAWVMERRLSVCHWFTVDTFAYLRHGGRVSATAATVGGVLNIKPLLCIATDGTLKVIKKPRGSKQAMRAQLSFMEAQWQEAMGNCVVIGHADAPLDAIDLRDKVEERFPTAQIHIADIGAVIGAHVGPGMLALIYWGSGRS